MTLSQALDLADQRQSAVRKRRIDLICGFEPLHLVTFLKGSLAQRFSDEAADLRTGLYGDLEGAISRAAESDADAAVLVLEWSAIDSRLGLRSTGGWGLSAQRDILDSCEARFDRLLIGLAALSSKMPVALAGPTLPPALFGHTPAARLSPQELRLDRQISCFLADAAANTSITVVNPTALDKLSPAASRSDPRMELGAGFPYSLSHASALAEVIVAALFPSAPMKGLITDLDNTLWAGILGEVGVGGVSWSLFEHSQIHGVYQQLLKHFSEIGVLLAVVSKNELALVEQALARKDLHVPRSALFPVQADWGGKSRHVAEILRVWNIGADSVVFVDDSEMELAEVRNAFPAITCLHFPAKKPSAAVSLFERLRDLFGKPEVNREDGLRLASIEAGEAFRRSAMISGGGSAEGAGFLRSLHDLFSAIGSSYNSGTDPAFLRGLQGCVTFDRRKNPANRRLLELVNKTNQFNLNGGRVSESEWLRLLADPDAFAIGISYEDKFGPLGTIGVVAGKRTGADLEVTTWVMSCRAFSRRIEHHTLSCLFETAGVGNIRLAFRATERNPPLREFLTSLGLNAEGEVELVLSRKGLSAGDIELPHRVVWDEDAVSEKDPGAAV
jgi:HAD superfamily phosphatase (TIGR01681 family)